MADQGVDEVAAEFYTVDPARFVAARNEAVHRARAAGEHQLAAALGKLRRPTVSAWAVNLLARTAQAQLTELAKLGEELRAAQQQLHAAQLRQLNQRRRELVGALSRRARELAADAGHPLAGAALAEVEQTLAAALADAQSAQAVCSGRLTRPLQYVGLGAEPVIPAPAASSTPAQPGSPSPAPAPAPPAPSEDEVTRQRRRREDRLASDLARAEQELEAAVAQAARAEQEVRQAVERCAEFDRQLAQLQRERDGAQRDHAEAQRRARSAGRVRDDAQRRVLRLTALIGDHMPKDKGLKSPRLGEGGR